ncbi:MAG: TRAP transporter small permease subunit [Acaryochloridaceae cyanobacterium RL_2_7]|nr:TRAP transporter small permease subunit [Acaryochloridaceae cyanobacterium RL_2_7]
MVKNKSSLPQTLDQISKFFGHLSALLVFLLVLIGGWNVIGRYLGRFIGMNLSSNTLLEIQWQLFATLFLLGSAYTLQQDEHVRVDVLLKDFNAKQKAIANLIGITLFLFPFCITVLLMSWKSVWNSCTIWEGSPNPGGLPLCPAKSMILLGFGLLLCQGISETLKSWQQLQAHQLPQQNQEDHHD